MGSPTEAATARAQRLARAIASDIAAYHPEAVAEGVLADTFFARLAPQLEEGLTLFRGRVDRDVDPDGRIYWRAVVDVVLARTGHIPSPMW